MNNCYKSILFLLISALTLLAGCNDSEEPGATLDSTLPETDPRTNATASMSVNGRPWLFNDSLEVTADFRGGYFLAIYISGRNPDLNMALIINKSVITLTTYTLQPSSASDSASALINYQRLDENCSYQFEDIVQGSLTITRFDNNGGQCHGQFEFTSVNNQCDTLRVRSGRFAAPLTL